MVISPDHAGHPDHARDEPAGLGGRAIMFRPRSPLTVFLVSFDFPPISGPGIWRALGFAKYLARTGHSVHVFCSDRASWHQRSDPTLLAEVPPSVAVHRLPSVLLSDVADAGDRLRRHWPAALRRLGSAAQWHLLRLLPAPELHWLAKVTGSLVTQSRRRRPDCVMTSGPPHICHLAGYALRRLRRIPWLADFRDPWSDDPSQWTAGPYQERLARRLEALVLRRADGIVTVSPSWQRYLTGKVQRLGGHLPVHLIRNGHDLRADQGLSAPPRAAGAPLHIHFAGVLQGGTRTNSLVDALARLREELGARLPVVTYTGFERGLRERIAEHGLDANVRNMGTLSWAASIQASLAADVLLVTVNTAGAAKHGMIPGKLYEAMALGRHIFALVPEGSDVATLLADYGDGTICDVDDVEAIARAVRVLVARHERGELRGDDTPPLPDPRAAQYSRESQAGELGALIEGLRRARKEP